LALIEVNELSKEYKQNVRKRGLLGAIASLLVPEHQIKRAVDSVSFSIERGETVGFIGPNGAGKSTTVKMLTGILVPTSGSISIGGLSPYKDRKKNAARIGVVFGQRTQLWWDLPVIDTFDLLRHIYRIPADRYKRNVEMFGELLGLHEFLHTPVRQLSLGQKMRAEIAASMLHDPELIFFDEPTIGLDVVAKERIREFLNQINQERKTTMLFTTHDMDDIEQTCSRMIIIDKGAKIYDGSVDEIKRTYGNDRVMEVEFSEKVELLAIPGVEVIRERDNRKWLKFHKDEVQVSQLINRLTSRYGITDLTVKEPDIENVIRQIYVGGIRLGQSLSGVS
jgi:ABC-2 type transport system ATP-binding protein